MLRHWFQLIVAIIVFSPTSARTDDAQSALATIRKFAAASDRVTYASFCAPDMVYIDHVRPYFFAGPQACEDEWDAAERWARDNRVEVKDWGHITTPSFVEFDDNQLYAVYPARAVINRGATQEVEKAFWTFVLRREGPIWKIRAATFSTVQFVPSRRQGKPRG